MEIREECESNNWGQDWIEEVCKKREIKECDNKLTRRTRYTRIC